MAEMHRAIREALYRLGTITKVHLERTHEGGGRLILFGADMEQERIAFNLSDADVFVEAYEKIRDALADETTLLPEEVEERVNMTRRHVYGPLYEAGKRAWKGKTGR